MKKKLLSAVVLCALGFIGCGGEEETNQPPPTPTFNTADNIRTWVEGKKLVMEGANIPSHPNGIDEDVNNGALTQCYAKVEMNVSGGNYAVASTLGTLRDAPAAGDKGTCDHTAPSGNPLTFTTTAVLIEPKDANCFNVTFTYPSFKQVGRGSMSADGKTMSLELFFEGAAVGADCAAGAVGAKTVKIQGADFTGNATQVYTISAQ